MVILRGKSHTVIVVEVALVLVVERGQRYHLEAPVFVLRVVLQQIQASPGRVDDGPPCTDPQDLRSALRSGQHIVVYLGPGGIHAGRVQSFLDTADEVIAQQQTRTVRSAVQSAVQRPACKGRISLVAVYVQPLFLGVGLYYLGVGEYFAPPVGIRILEDLQYTRIESAGDGIRKSAVQIRCLRVLADEPCVQEHAQRGLTNTRRHRQEHLVQLAVNEALNAVYCPFKDLPPRLVEPLLRHPFRFQEQHVRIERILRVILQAPHIILIQFSLALCVGHRPGNHHPVPLVARYFVFSVFLRDLREHRRVITEYLHVVRVLRQCLLDLLQDKHHLFVRVIGRNFDLFHLSHVRASFRQYSSISR